jgi:serine/threonine protein kinase
MAPDERDEILEDWLDQWEDAKEEGATLAPEVLCRDNPELLAEFKRRIKELERLDGFLEQSDDGVGANEPFVEIQAGRYRAKRLHAPGGLGEVFYANDDELNREVALKRLRPSIAWSRDARRRFLLEAEITGRLEHPGVVPVYGLGKDQNGNPYYAMRFIRGKTLDQAVEELHEDRVLPAKKQVGGPEKQLQGLRSLLHALKAACQTIAYAHAHAVLHRDIKPGNIILGDYGEVLVIDWGLAKNWDPSAPPPLPPAPRPPEAEPAPLPATANPEDTASYHLDATEVGQIKGTPAYMSPEQAEGNPATPASDIYSLGATLYKILTGTSPFKGDSALTIVRKVRNHELLTPRQVNPAVPPALEAICLKAMQLDPPQRYASALEFAQDLSNWLDDVPTLAWPEPWAVRSRRWMRKHPAVVGGLAAALSVILVFAGAWGLRERSLNSQLRMALKEAKEQKEFAQVQAKRADTNYQQAQLVVQKMLLRTLDPRWKNVPKLLQLQREQTELALGFFETIAAQPGQDPGVRADVAWGLIEAGKFQIAMGKDSEGKANLQSALDATAKLYDEAQDNLRITLLRSDALITHGAYLDSRRGTPLIEQGVELLETTWKKHPDSAGVRAYLINGLITLGAAQVNRQEYRQAEKRLVRAVELSQEILQATPDDAASLAICARARVNLCAAYRLLHRSAESKAQHELAERDLERLFKLDPSDRDTIEGLATLRINHAYDLAAEGQKPAAVEYLQRNTPMLAAALKREPDDVGYRDRLYRTHGLSAEILRQLGKTREAAETWEKSLLFVGPTDKPLRLVEGVEYWLDAHDLPRAIEAARRASAEVPAASPAALWARQGEALERLARLIDKDEQTPADKRKELAAEIRVAAVTARAYAGSNSVGEMLKGAFDFFGSGKP